MEFPYGTNEIEVGIAEKYASGSKNVVRKDQIRCCIRGCKEWLSKRKRGGKSVATCFCPEHGISISASPTYVYEERKRNFIIHQDLVSRVEKVEKWRLGNEKSEDAVSWNVFLSLQEMNALSDFVELVTGRKADKDPILYLWGNQISGTTARKWDKLQELRAQLEKGLQFATEPDIAIHVTGQSLIFCEAKFTSPNSMFKKSARASTIEEFLARYKPPPKREDPLNRKNIASLPVEQILEQLCRNAVFASWIANDNEDIWIVNLVRDEAEGEKEVESQLSPCLSDPLQTHFKRVTWEQIYKMAKSIDLGSNLLCCYMETKTASLKKAFNI